MLGYEAYLAGAEYVVAKGGDIEHAEFALAIGADDEPFCLFYLLHGRICLISKL